MVYELRISTVGLYVDNEGEFKNYKMEEFTNKLSLKLEFSSAFSQ